MRHVRQGSNDLGLLLRFLETGGKRRPDKSFMPKDERREPTAEQMWRRISDLLGRGKKNGLEYTDSYVSERLGPASKKEGYREELLARLETRYAKEFAQWKGAFIKIHPKTKIPEKGEAEFVLEHDAGKWKETVSLNIGFWAFTGNTLRLLRWMGKNSSAEMGRGIGIFGDAINKTKTLQIQLEHEKKIEVA